MVCPTLKRRRWSLVLKVFSPRHSAARWDERESPVGSCKYVLPLIAAMSSIDYLYLCYVLVAAM